MATKHFDKWNERVLQRNNTGTYTVTIPVNMVRDMRWQQGQRIVFEHKGKVLVIKDAPKR